MAVCPVCGCKTEELDFVEIKLQEKDYKVCSFCDRQLKVFDSESQPTEAQLRWLDAVISKDVSEREASLSSVLKNIRGKYPESQVQQPAETQQKIPAFQNPDAQRKIMQRGADFEGNNQIIQDLQKRIAALETEIRMMKRRQMIKTAIELGVPVVLFILLIIIVLSSGIIDNFKAIFQMAGF